MSFRSNASVAKWLVGAFLCGMIYGVPPAKAELKVGYIDSGKILSEYKGYAEAQQKLMKAKEDMEKEAAQMESEIKGLQSTLDTQKLLLSEEKRKEMEKQIEDKYETYQKFVNDWAGPQGKLDQKRAELSKPIFDKINALIDKIGKEGNYDFIFDALQGGLVYAKPQYDLTKMVLEEINKEEEIKSKEELKSKKEEKGKKEEKK